MVTLRIVSNTYICISLLLTQSIEIATVKKHEFRRKEPNDAIIKQKDYNKW